MASPSSDANDHVRRCLLALIGGDSLSSAEQCARLGGADWSQMLHMAHQHRLGPLLHQTAAHLADSAAIPQSVLAAWADAWRQAARRSLGAQATLLRLNEFLSEAGIAYAALKGARLAWHAYPHPAQRPMRDLDVLVSPARVLEAYRALEARGFVPLAASTTPLAVAHRDHKHLPALLDPASGIHVEVHSRLLEHQEAAHAAATLGSADVLLARLDWLPLAGAQIAYLPPEETLLHLIVHAAVEHRFDNGPQTLHDVAALLASTPIDWPRFWALAHEGGWARGCVMLLGLTEHHLGPQPIGWQSGRKPALPGPILDDALLLMLQDTDFRQDLAVQLRLGGALKQTGNLLGRIIPEKHIIAAHARIAPHSRWVWFYYPAWLFSRIKRTVRGATDQRQRAEAARALAVEAWLAGN